MKNVVHALQLAFTIFATFGACTYVGIKTGHVVIGIFVGFFASLGYLINIIRIKND